MNEEGGGGGGGGGGLWGVSRSEVGGGRNGIELGHIHENRTPYNSIYYDSSINNTRGSPSIWRFAIGLTGLEM